MNIYPKIKRLIDVAFATVAILIYLPVLEIIYLLIKIEDGGPVFIVEQRIGEKQKKIRLFRFRTMKLISGGNDLRYTRVGKFLIRSGLAEFPRLFNVLKGDLSVIGPRPIIPYELKSYTETQYERFLCRPGLTGYSQVWCRKNMPNDEKIVGDIYYVRSLSFLLDMKILLRTFLHAFEMESLGGERY